MMTNPLTMYCRMSDTPSKINPYGSSSYARSHYRCLLVSFYSRGRIGLTDANYFGKIEPGERAADGAEQHRSRHRKRAHGQGHPSAHHHTARTCLPAKMALVTRSVIT